MRLIITFIIAMVARPLLAECGCPSEATSKHVLISTGGGTSLGFVVCGYEEQRRARKVRGSEFQVFRCGDKYPALEFDALQTADLIDAGGGLNIVQVSNWPFGKGWSWEFVPVAETTLNFEAPQPDWRPRLPKPAVSNRDVRTFIKHYISDVERLGRAYAPDENVVAQLFTAMAAGNADAARLFQSMRQDVNLDGAAAEIYEIARAEYALGRPANSPLQRTQPRSSSHRRPASQTEFCHLKGRAAERQRR